jgi:hypothetical protein
MNVFRFILLLSSLISAHTAYSKDYCCQGYAWRNGVAPVVKDCKDFRGDRAPLENLCAERYDTFVLASGRCSLNPACPQAAALGTLGKEHDGCNFPHAQSNDCHAAASRFVKKNSLGNAAKAQEVGAKVFGVKDLSLRM